MTYSLRLPREGRKLESYTLSAPSAYPPTSAPARERKAYAAAHVVADPLADNTPGRPASLDWEATLAYRRHLWGLGLAVAEAMDTAQRGMGLDWSVSKELIGRSLAEARACGGDIACGAGTDQLLPSPTVTLADVLAAYEEQCDFIEGQGGRVILMASRALATCARGPEDYAYVYDTLLSRVARPVILHWLGEMFDPALAGYWGHHDPGEAMTVCLDVIRRHAAKIDGIKISLLDEAREIEMRRLLPPSVRMYTGDDFNFARLIRGDKQGYSHALLGIFDAIAPAAAAALAALDEGQEERYEAILAPTVPLSRHIFEVPTYYYKTGVVFLAYLNGHQEHFRMVSGLESARALVHLAGVFMLADQAGLLLDPERACEHMRRVLAVAGISG